MENIVIVHAISTGYNLVDDVLERGYYPVVLNLLNPGEGDSETREMLRPKIEKKCSFIEERETYEETLEAVKALKPKIVLAGAEGGVILATKLAEDLGLPGNPTSILPQMKEKASMHEALRKHGLRYIRGRLVASPEEAAAFYDELGVRRVVVKENSGASSVGLHICGSRQEVIDAVRTEFAREVDYFDRKIEYMLVQEMIDGTEYAVNTVSCGDDIHVTSIYRHYKTNTPGGARIYRFMESVNDLRAEEYTLVQYAFQAVRAIGVRVGAVHGEYMIDEKGPVLIEVNCRPMGSSMPASFLNLLNGHHETDTHLDAYLHPEKFKDEVDKPYVTYNKLVIQFTASFSEGDFIASPIIDLLPHLQSYYGAYMSIALGSHISRTVDLHTSAGTVFLAHKDSNVVLREAMMLCRLEDVYPDLVFQRNSIPEVPENCDTRWTDPDTAAKALRFGDDYTVFDLDKDKKQEFVRQKGYYGNVILDHTMRGIKWTFEEHISGLFNLVFSMKKGSKLVATGKLHYMDRQAIQYILISMELVGLKIEMPLTEYPDLLVASVQ